MLDHRPRPPRGDVDPASTTVATPYRDLAVGDAIGLAFADLARLGVVARVETFPGEHFSTHRCALHGPDDRVVGRSTGKGMGAQSLASALFEALELYFTATDQNRLGIADGDVSVLSGREIAEQPALCQDRVIQRLGSQQPDAAVGCLRMHHAHSESHPPVWYPLMLTDPGYTLHPLPGDDLAAASSLRRYTTSSGTAAGLTTAEAMAHALCEWVEHDAISHALLRWHIARSARPVLVDTTTLPQQLGSLVEATGKVIGAEVALIDITTDLGVPSFFACPLEPRTAAALWGAGTAPDPRYAAERALSELLQVATIYSVDRAHFDQSHQAMLTRLARWPAMQRACRCDISEMFGGAVPSGVDFTTVREAASQPEAVVASLLGLLDGMGFPCLVAPLHHPEMRTQVLAVRVPGLDRFGGQVIAGYPVLPTGRAAADWPGGLDE